MSITIREVSRQCGLSISSVSKALNNYPDVREETRLRVIQVAKDIGYYPNAIARGLKTNRTYNLGVLLDDEMRDSLLHTFFVVILNGFRREAERHGYDITLINRNVGERKMTYLTHCHNRHLDGVCLMCVDFFDPQVRELLNGQIPSVTIDHPFDTHDCVLADNASGVHTLVNHAVDLGHARIALVYGSPCYVTDVRINAFRKAMAAAGLPIRPEYLVPAHYHSTNFGGKAIRQLLNLSQRPTCVLMPDDYTALGGIDAALSIGVSVPSDLSVMGYDGTEMIQKIHPRLTTINQRGDEIGERAARLLIARLNNPNAQGVEREIVSSSLIIGETVAKVEQEASVSV